MGKHSPKIALTTFTILAVTLSSAARADDDDTVIEEVIVVGQKYERSLQDTPQSVTVVDDATIREENLLSVGDALNRIPNAVSSRSGTGFSLRGVRNDNVSGGGFANLSTIFLDGSPLSREATLAGRIDVWDLQQVEVLRGPQSTVQGRNSLAGAVILKTADPTFEWEARARVQALSEIDEKRYSIAFGGPLIDNQLAFRIAAETTDGDGSIRNITRGSDADTVDTDMIRAKLLWTPEGIPDLSVLLSYTQDDRTFGQRDALLDAPGSWDDRVVATNRRTFDDSESDYTVLNVSYDINDTYNLTWITTMSESNRTRNTDIDLTPVDSEFSQIFSETETTTSELRLSFTTERLTGLVGLWYSDIENEPNTLNTRFRFDVIEQFQLPLLLQGPPFLLDPLTAGFVSTFYTDPFLLDATADSLLGIETQALFADFAYELNDQWTLLAGFRYDREEQVIDTDQSVVIASQLPNPLLAGPAAPVLVGVNAFLQGQADAANTPGVSDDTEFEQFLPKLGLSYNITDDQTISLILQQGYRSGGVSGNAARVRVVQFDEETTMNYELSYRSKWMEDKLTLNGNIYFTDWEDQQVNVFLSSNSFDSEVRNAGSSELYGFELEANYLASENWNIYGAVGYAETEFTDFVVDDFVGGDPNLSGNEFANAPSWTLSVGATWDHPSGWIANVNANHTSDSFDSATDQDDGVNLPERTLVNFRAGWRNDNIGVYLIGRNIFDDEYFDTEFMNAAGAYVGRWGEPRVFGLSLEVDL